VAHRIIRLISAVFVLGAVPLAALARDYCPDTYVPNDATAETWLLANGPTLKYPSNDFYAYRTGAPKVATRETQPTMGHLFPADTVIQCPYDARFCIAGAVWSPDHKFIAFAVGDGSDRSSPEILVARVADQTLWRASTPEELLDIGEFAPAFYAFVGWPAWTFATTLQYTRCAPNGRFDLIMTLGSLREVRLPDWFVGGQPAPAGGDEIAALPRSLEFDPHAFLAGRGYISIAFDKQSNTTFVSSGKVAGTVTADGVLKRWTLPLTRSSHYGLSRFGAPHSMTSGSPGELYATDDPRNVFEASSIYGVMANGKSVPYASWDWNPAALAFDDHGHAIFVADPYANVIYFVQRGARPHLFSGRCETLYDGSVDPEVPQLCRGGDVNGPAATARFNQPLGLAYDAQDRILYVADTGNNEIRGVREDGSAFTLAGACVKVGDDPNCLGSIADGRGASARFSWPMGIVYDVKSRSLIVADTFNNALRRVLLDGTVTTMAGTGLAGQVDGSASRAQFYRPAAIVLEGASEDLLVVDRGSNSLRRVKQDGSVTTLVKPLF
jgi:hypothetical protein